MANPRAGVGQFLLALRHFEPDPRAHAALAALLRLCDDFPPALAWLLQILEDPSDRTLNELLLLTDRHLEDLLSEILHHPEFQHLETLWISLYRLLDEIDDDPRVQVEILSASKRELIEDFEDSVEVSDSGLFFQLYENEYNRAGGEPFGCLLLNHEFENNLPDLNLLRSVSKVAAVCHCPAVGNIGPRFFGASSYYDFEDIADFDLLFEEPTYTKWRALRDEEDARYLGLLLPEYLAREPYSPDDFERLHFEERFESDANMPWTYGTHAFAAVLARGFIQHGWCVNIRGPETGGRLRPDLDVSLGTRGFDVRQPPLRLTFSDAGEHQLSRLGFIVLNYYKRDGRICVFSAPTIQKFEMSGANSARDRLAASLPYVFLVSRIAHYQKVIQRENIGSVKEAGLIERELNDWLRGLVTPDQTASAEVRARRPLNGASLTVEPDPGNPGYFKIQLLIQPHLQVEGVNAELALVSRVER